MFLCLFLETHIFLVSTKIADSSYGLDDQYLPSAVPKCSSVICLTAHRSIYSSLGVHCNTRFPVYGGYFSVASPSVPGVHNHKSQVSLPMQRPCFSGGLSDSTFHFTFRWYSFTFPGVQLSTNYERKEVRYVGLYVSFFCTLIPKTSTIISLVSHYLLLCSSLVLLIVTHFDFNCYPFFSYLKVCLPINAKGCGPLAFI